MGFQDGKRMLGDIKSKLGFGSKKDDQAYDEYDDYEGYDEYDEYSDEYGDGYDDGYGQYDDYGTPSARSSRYSASSSARSSFSTSSSRREASMPRLVSIEDVRANTQVPSSLNRDPLSSRSASSVTSTSRGGRTMVDSSLPPQMTPEGTAATAASASRRRSSEGLESLFTPTTGTGSEPVESPAPSYSGPTVTTRAAYDPYDSYAGSSFSSYSASRSLTVLKPVSYGEVERVARALKAGDAVVICLGNTPDSLAKRILDFSFGVASALDASVDCIADKVFVIARGNGITEAERANLRAQGVL